MEMQKKDIRSCKFGLFVHYVLYCSQFADGRKPKDINEAVDNFDVEAFADSVVEMQSANNLIVIHTLSGSAHVAAEAVDSLKWTEILGTIAGDNTILVIVRSNEEVDTVMRRFRSIIK